MAQIFINANRSAGTINKNIYGHFAEHLGRCIYGGLANADGTPRADVIEALKGIDVPVLRWPGGCFADTYHWRDGVGPKAQRKTIVNTNWGGVTENNAFGTHEFLEVCRQLGCDPYISGNVGSGTVQEFSDWVEYCNMPGVSPMADLRRQNGGDAPFNVQYWGVGNENWGCGGNMRPEHYADLCRQYATFLRSYDNDAPLYKIACGPSNDDYRWTKVVAEQAGRYIDALSLHYYTLTLKDGDWQQKGSATEFSRCELYEALRQAMRMEEMVENHGRIMRRVCPEKKLGLVVDEWGTWFDVEPGTNPGFLYQQNTMRDALVAALTLNIFNNHCDTVVMANIAQIANVLQSMVLTEGDKLLLTPTYHVFKMYKGFMDATYLPTTTKCDTISCRGDSHAKDGRRLPLLSASAARQADGSIIISLANPSLDQAQDVEITLQGVAPQKVNGRILSCRDVTDHNDFAHPEAVAPKEFSGARLKGGLLKASIPAKSIVVLNVTANGRQSE